MQFKQRVLDTFKQSWYNDIDNKRVLTFYKNYKLSFDFENYLNALPNNSGLDPLVHARSAMFR